MLIYDLDIQFGFGQIGIDTYKGFVDSKMNIQESFDLGLNHQSFLLSIAFLL